ncbi:MAG: response regulator [Gomphosphaeria aponina SAG 52.96 = DSM 107014]|uniref:Response regulator n=1 Tax=Gomphosphaeria aponina SAG 52.96 = DSM 107014 TaxID=1521640 RepID=A0A941JUZ1_9CHRO|nr:response regulator [Gomphosphaeria aponina SAG 52.96 = DSM 107014]
MNYPLRISTQPTISAVNTSELEKPKILVVDDHPLSRITAVDLLSLEGYEVLEAESGETAIKSIRENNPDLILLDVMMPDLDGFELCKRLKQDEKTSKIPVILMTVSEDRRWREQGMEVGADEFLSKPLERMVLSTRVKSLIEQKRLNEGLDQTEQVLFLIAKAIENRYSLGDDFSRKLADLVRAFALYLQLSPGDIQSLIYAANLHDIGTVGIPDSIMLKQGKLTAEEREIIKQHVLIGEQICQPLRARRGILPIIRHHHERWDGKGYPDGLMGSEIPFLAQVFQIVDIYDALTSKRPYKKAFSSEEALEIIAEEAKEGWRNTQLVEQFIAFIRAES